MKEIACGISTVVKSGQASNDLGERISGGPAIRGLSVTVQVSGDKPVVRQVGLNIYEQRQDFFGMRALLRWTGFETRICY